MHRQPRLAIFATLPTPLVKVTRTNGTDNMHMSSPSKRYIHEGKNGKGRACLFENLCKLGGKGATPALGNFQRKGKVTEVNCL